MITEHAKAQGIQGDVRGDFLDPGDLADQQRNRAITQRYDRVPYFSCS
ncbi:MAG: hypothetical protein LJE69_10160 [Thiohalocapsa sp.]|nr:hypothetical protein [Thiohalocapsa sp.]MCG6941601.1 hypothetical protein [Thiohalocapsa sp.]